MMGQLQLGDDGMRQHRAASSSSAKPTKPPNRTFFHRVEPTFCVDLPETKQIRFLDESDPKKDTIVRRHARDWVYRKQQLGLALKKNKDKAIKARKTEEKRSKPDEVLCPLKNVSAGTLDPFNAFPKVGRKIDHIIEYFFTSCPDELPFADDKYAWRERQQLTQVSKENLVLVNMSESLLSFVLWLHATTLIRDGIAGGELSEEAEYYYKLSLQTMQKAVNDHAGVYSDSLICGVACFMACASFGGMFDVAQIHHSALVKAITLRGKGDITAGFRQYKPFTQKAVIWCELSIAAQTRALPKIPYTLPNVDTILPPPFLKEVDHLTNLTLSNIPPVSSPLRTVFRLMHQVALFQVTARTTRSLIPKKMKVDEIMLQSMYDLEYTLLEMLSAHKTAEHAYSKLDIMLTEACQMFFWIGPRGLPQAMKLCDRQVAWLKDAILGVISEIGDERRDSLPAASLEYSRKGSNIPSTTSTKRNKSTTNTDNAILWCLCLGAMVSSTHSRPEYTWYQKHFWSRTKKMGIKSRKDLDQVLRLFPCTDGFRWIEMWRVDCLFDEAIPR